jgi:hypothetical protein
MSDAEREHPRTKDGYILSGVCDRCGNAIYRFNDHGDCLYGMMEP